jgi:hypothetical protein
MSKNITEILSGIVSPEQLKTVTETVEAMLNDAKVDLEAKFDEKLKEAYEELSGELKEAEKTAETGYAEAFGIITDLRNRLDTQGAEFKSALDEGYEEAYQLILQERAKKEGVEGEMYEQYDKKLAEMREFMIDKIDEFFQHKGKEIYEQARRDVLNDPRMAEHRVTLNKVVETVADYISDEEFALATSAKLEQAHKESTDLKSQLKIVEAKNIRLSTHMTKLEEQVRQSAGLLKEGTKNERVEGAKKVEGRGKQVTENVEVIREATGNAPRTNKKDEPSSVLTEDIDWSQMATLAGIKETPAAK